MQNGVAANNGSLPNYNQPLIYNTLIAYNANIINAFV
jgi:hypothetical protein